MSSYRFVEQIDDRLRDDLMELYRHEWWTNQRRDEDVARMLQHSDWWWVSAPIPANSWSASRGVDRPRVQGTGLRCDRRASRPARRPGRQLIDYRASTTDAGGVRHLDLYCKPELIPSISSGDSPRLGQRSTSCA
jgi:hypothetical protein